MRSLLLAAAACAFAVSIAGQSLTPAIVRDSDHDGLSDAQESALLAQFEPHFFIARHDCSVRPARFIPGVSQPTVAAEDGTLYGQATPRAQDASEIELHYYLLWRTDCGEMGHPLDAEHVSALVQRDGDAGWKALDWYAAAHEDTVCDASQITRASTLGAEEAGPAIWISYGKHAAYLNRKLCSHGCGGDSCSEEIPLQAAGIVNLGEPGRPANGAVWVASPEWPLEDKLRRSDFPVARVDRLSQLPATDVAWANPDLRPVQAVILGGNDALDGGATGFRATNTALVIANTHTSHALGSATKNTGRALGKTYRSVLHALDPEPAPSSAAPEQSGP
jgi:hypothetical protein